MKKMVLLAMALSMAAVVSAADAPKNLIGKLRPIDKATSTIAEDNSVKVANPGKNAGAMIDVVLNQTAPKKIKVSALSKATDATAKIRNDYSLYLDVRHPDKTSSYGALILPFNQGTHDWEKVEGEYMPTKPISRVNVYLLFRNGTGTVEFKELTFNEVE